MQLILKNSFDSIEPEAWNSLVNLNEVNTIFQTFEWNYSYWRAFGKGKELFLIISTENNRLLGIAPLMISEEISFRKKTRVLKFIGHGYIGHSYSDYSDFIIKGDKETILSKMFDLILREKDRWDKIELKYVPGRSTSNELVPKICKDKKLFCLMDSSMECPALVIKDNLEYARKVLNKESLKEYHNYFVRKGEFELQHLREQAEIEKYLDPFFQQHINRWGITDSPSLFLDVENRTFYKEVAKNLSKNRWLVFTVAKSHREPIAFHFGFDYDNKFIFYKPTFEISLFKHSPGQALLKELLKYAILNNKDEFDFTVGAEAYKGRFTNRIARNYTFVVFKEYTSFKIRSFIVSSKSILKSASFGRLMVNKIKVLFKRLKRCYFPQIIHAIRKNGMALFAYKLLKIFIKKIFFSYNSVYVFEIPKGKTKQKQIDLKIDNIEILEATMKDLFSFDNFETTEQKNRYLLAAFNSLKQGNRFFVGKHNGKIVSILWVSEKSEIDITEVRTKLDIGSNSICIFACMTIPQFRRKNVYSYMLDKIATLFNDRKKVIYCEASNVASKRGILKAGFCLKEELFLINIMGLKFRWKNSNLSKCIERQSA